MQYNAKKSERNAIKCKNAKIAKISGKTSPPSARLAAMRFLLQQIAKQNLIERNTRKTFYEIFLKHTFLFLTPLNLS